MWAFSEGLEVIYLVVLMYLLWPVFFNVVGQLFKRGTNGNGSDRPARGGRRVSASDEGKPSAVSSSVEWGTVTVAGKLWLSFERRLNFI